ncbi:AAA family ATPase [Achromobacter sp. UMC71]|uniref:AAA family ATPase n=1 Tax=Achromobacter sp. UMC71 TaxID=1862320 RepID=UPI0015FF2A08|nr:AAA family ATPase [Achromobacter sp. UMC71]MBB1627780.1 hypothetical protein [Achromobacter sp. UMC71]
MSRPVLYVLAGVNGAGKSSVGGHVLTQGGMTWFNPDSYARALMQQHGCSQQQANGDAWLEGVRRLDVAVEAGFSFAFETTLGGRTIVEKLIAAAGSHDILMWFCGLRDAEQHIARVAFRVTQGGHPIPEARIRERCRTSYRNLLDLMPHLAYLRVYDNSADVGVGQAVPEPVLVLQLEGRAVLFPTSISALRATPGWAKPLVEAALSAGE